MLEEVRDVLHGSGIELNWDDSVPTYLVKKGYSTVYGARNLRRLIQKEVEDEVAAWMIEARGNPIRKISLSADDSHILCTVSAEEA
jgi:ATP-dependent Clp protease ATP-binding subunit ClpB